MDDTNQSGLIWNGIRPVALGTYVLTDEDSSGFRSHCLEKKRRVGFTSDPFSSHKILLVMYDEATIAIEEDRFDEAVPVLN